MADEPIQNGNEPTHTPGAEGGEATVTMSQEKLNSLINDKFAKGATKANSDLLEALGVESIDSLKDIMKERAEAEAASKTELEKANETITTLNATMDGLNTRLAGVEADKKINSLAAENGIKEVEYFKFEYNKASKVDGFDEKIFIGDLLKTKGSLLTGVAGVNITNPPNVPSNSDGKTITMSAYSLLGSKERQTYKANQITKG